ncbi:hypothetical protein L5515_003061 [Caenorhabditis briggsae]|uniref:Uncharacterized protein n=1 Tax=Caenorhabditis briggsae TaxID=6238 RepID=A0AAE9EH83_CAEBR|nr:hypothetical protein L5515_003061 [Caenorhabditis briggsae]
MSLKFLILIILICILIEVVGPHPVGFHSLNNPFTHPLRCAENNSTLSNCLISNSENAGNLIIVFLPFLFSIFFF